MMGGKGGLNIKDYPFAFSIATLLFPSILQSGNSLAPFLAIILVGGMLGSLLTVVNPIGLIMREIYWRTSQVTVYPKLYRQNRLVTSILKKNFRASLSSPSISYEQDKMVGMIYFLIILGLALFRTMFQDFANTLNLNEIGLWSIRIGAMIAFSSVFVVLYYNIRGFVFRKSKKTISHLDRIRTVTVSNLAVDFSNLSNEGQRWLRFTTNSNIIIPHIAQRLSDFSSLDDTSYTSLLNFLDQNALYQMFQSQGHGWQKEWNIQGFYTNFKVAREISNRYNISIRETLTWFESGAFLGPVEFDEPISQLQSTIESRDWYNATLKTFRITDRLEDFLEQKKMKESL